MKLRLTKSKICSKCGKIHNEVAYSDLKKDKSGRISVGALGEGELYMDCKCKSTLLLTPAHYLKLGKLGYKHHSIYGE